MHVVFVRFTNACNITYRLLRLLRYHDIHVSTLYYALLICIYNRKSPTTHDKSKIVRDKCKTDFILLNVITSNTHKTL